MTAVGHAQARGASDRFELVAAVHERTLERAVGRIYATYVMFSVAEFWLTTQTVRGQRPGSEVAGVLLSMTLVWQAALAFRRPPSQRDLGLLAAASGIFVLAIRLFAVPGSAFLDQAAYLMVPPVAVAWAVWSRRLVVLVPILLIIAATGAWHPAGDVPIEQLVVTLEATAFTAFAARVLRSGARHADADADRLARELASQDAALAAEEAQRRAANAVHDDVLSVLRAVASDGRQVPWSTLVGEAKQARAALARQDPAGRRGFGGLEPALRRQARALTRELDVRCQIEDDLDVPAVAAEAITSAVGEALRNIAAHAGVHEATVTACGDGAGGAEVTIRDSGRGFDPAHVDPASSGLRNSIRRRLEDAGGSALVSSSPGRGTTVVLEWKPKKPATEAADPFAWARRLAPSARSAFLAFMLPFLVGSVALLIIRWQDMRWKGVEVAVLIGLAGLAWVCARCLARVGMTVPQALGLMAAGTTLAAAGSLGVAPGTADAFAYWVAGVSGIVVAVVYFVRGPVLGLTTLALDIAALSAGLDVTGSAMPIAGWLLALAAPAIGAGFAVGFRIAVRGTASYTERQLASSRDRMRRQARAEAMSRVDSAALEHARTVAGPVLGAVALGREPDPELWMDAGLANATLRDELLAPGFLSTNLAERVREARIAGATVTIDVPWQEDAALVESARDLLGAALRRTDDAGGVTLQLHPPGDGEPALLLLHMQDSRSDQARLRERAHEHGAIVNDLGDHELLVQLAAVTGSDPEFVTGLSPFRG